MIYVDSCLLIYVVEKNAAWGVQSAAAIANATDQLAISALVKLECLVGPIRTGDRATQNLFTAFFARFQTLELPEAAYIRASEIRARNRLKTPDALHVACALHHGCKELWTNDTRLTAASGELARNVL